MPHQPVASDPDATGAYHPEPTPPAAEHFALGAVLAGRYRIAATLGMGGMGEVYRADDLSLSQAATRWRRPWQGGDAFAATRRGRRRHGADLAW